MQSLLESDVYLPDKRTVSTQKILFKIWENRNNPDMVKELADLLSKFADEKRVFKDIEFYIPQLAHLIVHLDMNSKNQNLEKLAMVICQISTQTALQMSFMFVASLEDYQPESSDGKHNHGCNPFYFKRSARLLQDLERAVIYGSQILSNTEEKVLLRRATASGDTMSLDENELKDLKKDEIAAKISRNKTEETYEGLLSGVLYYKRVVRKSNFRTKGWKEKFFVVDQKVLLCFQEPHSVNPLRAISLTNCQVEIIDNHPKYGDTRFDVVNYSNNQRFQIRALDKAMRDKWVSLLKCEILGAPSVEMDEEAYKSDSVCSVEATKMAARAKTMCAHSEEHMTVIQRKRFHHFKQMRIFLTNLTNICERLRFKEKVVRKFFLNRDMRDLVIPPFSYLPLIGSHGTFQQILRALPSEGHAFSTKARCPALMLFEMEDHPQRIDVATFLGTELERFEETEIIEPGIEIKYSSTGTSIEYPDDELESVYEGDADQLPSKLGKHNGETPAIWKDGGTGQHRLEGQGFSFKHLALNDLDEEDDNDPVLSASMAREGKQPSSESKSSVSVNNNSTMASTTVDSDTSAVGTDLIDVELKQNTIFGETFSEKAERLRAKSAYGHLDGWKLGGLIAKSNDDVRQEVFVIQLIKYYQLAFLEADLPVWIYTYRIMSTSQSTGLIELIPDAMSLDGLKKKPNYPGSLRAYFEKAYGYVKGQPEPPAFTQAIKNYVASMAGYSIVCYLLAIKDRHNGNIMVDKDGHVIHIDFGFVFGLAPGKAFSLEKAPWKLTAEMAEVMGGPKSETFQEYIRQCTAALLVARKHFKQVKTLMEIMSFHSSYPAFRYNSHSIRDFRSRLFLDMPDNAVEAQVRNLMKRSYNSTGTSLYDRFQLATNGIAV